jgi:hypothetical protein
MENLISLNEKVSSLESNKNELAELRRVQDQLFERLRKIERQ